MTRPFAYLIAASFVIAATTPAQISASQRSRTFEPVDILVSGTPQPRFVHGDRLYVEAQKGREYAIRLRNPYPVRVAVALSVDGLNTIDARESTAADARKWVIEPYQTIVISGWQTSRSDARRFEFTTEEQSYGQALGKISNLGVISAAYFKERVVTYTPEPSREIARGVPAPVPLPPPSPTAPMLPPSAQAPQESAKARAADEYAATGMGRRTGHAIEEVFLDLEAAPALVANIRYEFRPQLVKLGILPPIPTADPLSRRERSRGFEPGFSPEPPRKP